MKTFVSTIGSSNTSLSNINLIFFSFSVQIALFALAAVASAETEPFYGLAGYPYMAGAAAMPYAVPQVEQPSGFYYHVQTYDKVPQAPAVAPAAYAGWNAAAAWNPAAWNAGAWNPAWNGAYNWAGALPYAGAAWNGAWNPAWNGAWNGAAWTGFPAVAAVPAMEEAQE